MLKLSIQKVAAVVFIAACFVVLRWWNTESINSAVNKSDSAQAQTTVEPGLDKSGLYINPKASDIGSEDSSAQDEAIIALGLSRRDLASHSMNFSLRHSSRVEAGLCRRDLASRIKPNESIFFIETNDQRTHLPSQLYCSLESAARQNPQRNVFLLLPCQHRVEHFPEHLSTYPNIHIEPMNYTELVRGSNVEGIWQQVEKSKYKLQTMSNVLRVLILFKYGGYYMDTDFISLRTLDSVRNFIVMEDFISINNAFMHFDQRHELLKALLEDMPKMIPLVDVYMTLGAVLLTMESLRFCKTVQPGRCSPDLEIRSPELFYPIHYLNFYYFYDRRKADQVEGATNQSIAVHVYNFACRVYRVCIDKVKSGMPLFTLMEKNCPLTLKSVIEAGKETGISNVV